MTERYRTTSGSTGAPPTALTFPDRKSRGRLPVLDAAGVGVASISARWTGTGFTVHDAAGAVLCQAAAGAWGLSRTWRVTGPDGRPLMTMTKALWRKGADVRTARDEHYVVRSSVWKRDFVVTDEAGRAVLRAAPRTAALSLRPHDYRVEQLSPVFSLPEFVALVQIWRTSQKGEAGSAAAGGAVVAST